MKKPENLFSKCSSVVTFIVFIAYVQTNRFFTFIYETTNATDSLFFVDGVDINRNIRTVFIQKILPLFLRNDWHVRFIVFFVHIKVSK